MRHILLACIAFLLVNRLAARSPDYFKPNDVVALVGGEDMVVASELGYLETLIQSALPTYKLKFRSLAWEGDTVFLQARDLNYPTLEAQLDRIGATVVICQFGLMECLDGKQKLPDFITAYEKLVVRLAAGGKRRMVVVAPWEAGTGVLDDANARRLSPEAISPIARKIEDHILYADAAKKVASLTGARSIGILSSVLEDDRPHKSIWHLNQIGHQHLAHHIAKDLVENPRETKDGDGSVRLRELVNAKNKLWFNYYRPQNWAFLAGDRTNQPSSRDHKDPSKRWFPEELEKFLPLIEAKEQEIWTLADKLNKEGGAK